MTSGTLGTNPGKDGPLDLGVEARRLDHALASPPLNLGERTRDSIWASARAILSHGPPFAPPGATGLALGYVQSGKTTSITALLALAADQGYRIMVALLGVTTLLLEQNTTRIQTALGIGERADYRWVPLGNLKGKRSATELRDWVGRGRVIFIPVLKHAGRLRDLADALRTSGVADHPAIIVDDEADQASLNTKVKTREQSETFAAIRTLRSVMPNHLYVQYTATPYAPLLLEPHDELSPNFVEILQPGPGYTGGREFFVDHADRVVRPIPTLDEQVSGGLPSSLPSSLIAALGSFVAGTAMLLGN